MDLGRLLAGSASPSAGSVPAPDGGSRVPSGADPLAGEGAGEGEGDGVAFPVALAALAAGLAPGGRASSESGSAEAWPFSPAADGLADAIEDGDGAEIAGPVEPTADALAGGPPALAETALIAAEASGLLGAAVGAVPAPAAASGDGVAGEPASAAAGGERRLAALARVAGRGGIASEVTAGAARSAGEVAGVGVTADENPASETPAGVFPGAFRGSTQGAPEPGGDGAVAAPRSAVPAAEAAPVPAGGASAGASSTNAAGATSGAARAEQQTEGGAPTVPSEGAAANDDPRAPAASGARPARDTGAPAALAGWRPATPAASGHVAASGRAQATGASAGGAESDDTHPGPGALDAAPVDVRLGRDPAGGGPGSSGGHQGPRHGASAAGRATPRAATVAEEHDQSVFEDGTGHAASEGRDAVGGVLARARGGAGTIPAVPGSARSGSPAAADGRAVEGRPPAETSVPAGQGDARSAVTRAGFGTLAETLRSERPGGFAALAERVVDALHLSAVRGGSEIRLRLEPAGLGHIDVRVDVRHDGVRAVILTEHEATRALLASQQHVLEAALTRSELRLTGFSVDVDLGHGADGFGEAPEQGRAGEGESEPLDVAPRRDPATATEPVAALPPGRLSLRV